MAGDIAQMTVPCDGLAPVCVRRLLVQLPELGAALGDALLVASELVTNAVLHSRCGEQDDLLVSVEHAEDCVRLSVRDPGLSGQTARILEDPRWFGGLGLRIVEQLAARWGSQRHADGYEVWAELPLLGSGRRSMPAPRAWSS